MDNCCRMGIKTKETQFMLFTIAFYPNCRGACNHPNSKQQTKD